jgi:hypothetical protein
MNSHPQEESEGESGRRCFLFVGERPSPRAERIGATWQNAKLAGKTLRSALSAIGLDPEQQDYINLWPKATPGSLDEEHEANIITYCRSSPLPKVALGQRVARVLSAHAIPHLPVTHPAARGAIRKAVRYQEHLRQVLANEFTEKTHETPNG